MVGGGERNMRQLKVSVCVFMPLPLSCPYVCVYLPEGEERENEEVERP